MHRITPTRFALLAVAASLIAACTVLGTGPDVTVLRAPADAKLPQVAIDDSGMPSKCMTISSSRAAQVTICNR